MLTLARYCVNKPSHFLPMIPTLLPLATFSHTHTHTPVLQPAQFVVYAYMGFLEHLPTALMVNPLGDLRALRIHASLSTSKLLPLP